LFASLVISSTTKSLGVSRYSAPTGNRCGREVYQPLKQILNIHTAGLFHHWRDAILTFQILGKVLCRETRSESPEVAFFEIIK
jgi:hypothetical protein